MRFEISNQLSALLRKDGRNDLANQGEIDVPDVRYLEVFAEAQQQHPEEDTAMLRDRALFRILTHPEWGPTRKQVSLHNRDKHERWLRYAWAIAILLLLLLLLIRSGHAQDKRKEIYQAQGNEPIQAEVKKSGIEPGGGLRSKLPTPEKADPPPLTAEQKFRIRDLQHRYDELRLQMAKLELDKMKLEKQLGDALSQLNGVAYDIARESKVTTNDYNLNIDLLIWEKRK